MGLIDWLAKLFPKIAKETAREMLTKEQKEELRLSLLSQIDYINYYLSKIDSKSVDEKLLQLLTTHDLIRGMFNPVKVADANVNDRSDWIWHFVRNSLGCGIVYHFVLGDFYGLTLDEYKQLIDLTLIDTKKYVSEFYDCDNFAITFMGIANYITQAKVVGIITGGIFLDKYCNTKPIGYHAWNYINVLDDTCDDPTAVYKYRKWRTWFYEPQNDKISRDGQFGKYWYRHCCGFVGIL